MTAPPVWGGKPLTSTDWADDVEEEEAVQGALQAPAAIKVDEQAFPSLGAQPQKGKKRGKGRSIGLAEFQSQGASFSSRDRTAQILSSLPTHASGIEHGDPGHYRSGGMGGMGGRDEYEVSKADQSDSWGADRSAAPVQPGARPGGFARGGPGGFSGGGGGFGRGGGDDDANWGRGGGGQPDAPRPSRGFDREGAGASFGRADQESSWGRASGGQQQPPPERRGGPGGGFGGSAPHGDEAWSRGSGQAQPEMPQRSGFGGDARAAEGSSWGRTSGQPPPSLQQPSALGPSRADEESKWGRSPRRVPSSQALRPEGRSTLHEVDLADNWGRGKPKATGSARGPGSGSGSAAGASDRPDDARPSRAAADDATDWRIEKATVKQPPPASAGEAADSGEGKEGRSDAASTWDKAPARPVADAVKADDGRGKEGRSDAARTWDKAPAQPAPAQPAQEASKADDGGKEGRSDTAGAWDKTPQPTPKPTAAAAPRVGGDPAPRGAPVSEGEPAQTNSRVSNGAERWGAGKKVHSATERSSAGSGGVADKGRKEDARTGGRRGRKPSLEPAAPSAEETALEAKVAALQIRMDNGEGDADADDAGADDETMTIAQALQARQGELDAMKQKRLDAPVTKPTPAQREGGKWARTPAPAAAAPPPQASPEQLEHAEVSAAVEDLDPDDAEGFQTVARSHKKPVGARGAGGGRGGRGPVRGKGPGRHSGREGSEGRGGRGAGRGRGSGGGEADGAKASSSLRSEGARGSGREAVRTSGDGSKW